MVIIQCMLARARTVARVPDCLPGQRTDDGFGPPRSAQVPTSGRYHPITLIEKLQSFALLPIFLLGLRVNTVHRCTFTDDPAVPAVCTDAFGGKVTMQTPNGITTTPDRQTVFVNDVSDMTITAFRPLPSGVLEPVNVIPLEFAVDNVDFHSDGGSHGQLWMGTIPELGKIIAHIDDADEAKPPFAGSAAVVDRLADGGWGPPRVMYTHDGTKLS